MIALWLYAGGILVSAIGFWIFANLAYTERSAEGRSEIRPTLWSLFRIAPRFGAKNHYTARGWRYRQAFMIFWFLFIAFGIMLVLSLPAYMNG